jgi:hypothetical protein
MSLLLGHAVFDVELVHVARIEGDDDHIDDQSTLGRDQKLNGQPKKLKFRSRAKNATTKVTTNQIASRIEVILRFFFQYRWWFSLTCIDLTPFL